MLATEDFGYSQKTCDLCVGDKKNQFSPYSYQPTIKQFFTFLNH